MAHASRTTPCAKLTDTTREMLAAAVRQLDPHDPTSPAAKQAAELRAQHERLARQMENQYGELTDKVTELATALRVEEARRTLTKVTPIKGGEFEGQVHDLKRGIASGLGDEYDETGALVGPPLPLQEGRWRAHHDRRRPPRRRDHRLASYELERLPG
jgi:hypothetical protein